MIEIISVGLDNAKNWFQVHAADAEGKPVLRRKLRRDQVATLFAALPPTVVGIEACSTSHHWARTIAAAGHRVRLILPQYVKPFVKRSKTDSADAEAICEALRRAGIRDVAVKSREQQAALAVHRARDLLVRQRTMLTNAIRGFAAEFGIVARQGPWHVSALREHLKDVGEDTLPAAAARAMALLFDQFDDLGERIDELEQRILAWHRASDVSRRLATVPGIGLLNATLILGLTRDVRQQANAEGTLSVRNLAHSDTPLLASELNYSCNEGSQNERLQSGEGSLAPHGKVWAEATKRRRRARAC